jgi:MFS family permease
LNHFLGRRGEIFLTALVLFATPIASGFTHSWQALFAVRFILGIGIGAKNATVPIFSSELAPARIRGALVMFWQLWVTFGKQNVYAPKTGRLLVFSTGIFAGFAANVIVKNAGKIAWRLQLGSAFIPAFFLALGIWFCPESPRWLMKHGKHDKAFQSFLRLRAHPIIAARDFYYSYIIYQEEILQARGASYLSRLKDCFTVPRIRRANYGASTVMLAQQMCGINSGSLTFTPRIILLISPSFIVISFYSSTIFVNVGYTADQALFASLGYGALQFVSTIPTVFLIDTKGRRTLCLIVRISIRFTSCLRILMSGVRIADVPSHVHIPAGRRAVSFEDGRDQGREARAVGTVSSLSSRRYSP